MRTPWRKRPWKFSTGSMPASLAAGLPAEWRPLPPSPLYYATLLIPAAERALAVAIWQHKALLDEIPLTCSDPGVAAAKLAWWQQEFARAANREARHPLTRLWSGDEALGSALAALAEAHLYRGRQPAISEADEYARVHTSLVPLGSYLARSPDEAAGLTRLLTEWQLAEELVRVGEALRARHPIWPQTLASDAAALSSYCATRTQSLASSLKSLDRRVRHHHPAAVCLVRGTLFALRSLRGTASELLDGRPQAGPGIWLWLAVRSRLLG